MYQVKLQLNSAIKVIRAENGRLVERTMSGIQILALRSTGPTF